MTIDAWLQRLALAALAMLGGTTLLPAALSTPDQSMVGPEFLTGQLLVAAPSMGDPRFDHTVVLVVRHDASGALGLVINRPVGEQSVARVLELLGEKESAAAGSIRVFLGGPVQPEIGFVIHSGDYHLGGDVNIDGRVAVTVGADLLAVLRDIGGNRGPQKSLLAFGYAGWGPGQLEFEMTNHVWTTVPEEPSMVFDEDREKLWERASMRRT